MNDHRPTGVRVVIPFVFPILALAGVGWAQEQYELTDSDAWEVVARPEPGSPEGALHAARTALAAGQDERAEYLATQWIERHSNHPQLPEAYLLRGDALLARDDLYLALFDYEYVARTFHGSEAFVAALERELAIARKFATGTKRRLWGMRIVAAENEAEELLIRIQERLPGSQLAEEAGLTLGDFYFAQREMDLAAEMYALFIENFPRSRHLRKVRKRLIYAYLASFKGPEFDASGLYEARTRLQRLKVVDPVTADQMGADALLTRIDESDARKLLTTVDWYVRTGDPVAAELVVRRLVRRYPRSVATVDALRIIEQITERLPDAVLAEAPDYASLRAAVLAGEPLPETASPPTADDADASSEPTP
ncbi:MAG: outer membrane protein assembly factor BamD [Phycisphaerales bacterium]|nr:outer membrane protein assembly factor BamD [Phycisphaerae bacterium]NNF42451.1 outer membrane protein assembly factor BamD [Phycisphaerales bacterium]NNM26020.1 outer membrane protein assembly factor BamD [Phycisphaerales bacterium]